MHISDEILKAKLDGELREEDKLAVEKHTRECARCRARAEDIAAQAGRVNGLLAVLEPPGAVDAASAWTRLRARAKAVSRAPVRWRWWPLAPAWSALSAAAVLMTVLLVSPPARAVAQRLLGFLRVRSVVVVPLDRNVLGEGKGKLIGQLLSESVTVTKDEEPQPATSREEANRLAGFTLRLPAARSDAPRFTVQGAHSFYFTAEAKRLQMMMSVLGRPDLQLPPGLDGAKVAVDIPRAVTAAYSCPQRGGASASERAGCVVVVQVPTPTVVTLPELNLADIARVGLELTGMTPQEAETVSRAVDWTSTLAIPLPREAGSYEDVAVDGVRGVLATSNGRDGRTPVWMLLWIKNGVIYSMRGFGSSSAALPLAESLG